MKAMCIHEYGGPDVLRHEDMRVPDPAADEVLVRVNAAGLNPADRQIRAGLRGRLDAPFSLVLGIDIAGLVEAVGAGVEDFAVGDAVFGASPNMGGYAEYVATGTAGLAHKPGSLDDVQAAAMPVVLLTAWQALFEAAELRSGQTVLIHAAAGGVGHVAVQLAKWKGARVIGTASARNESFLRELGVDEFVDYEAVRFEDVVGEADAVLDCIPREASDQADRIAQETIDRSWGVLRPGGVLVSICTQPSSPRDDVQGRYGHSRPERGWLAEAAELVSQGVLRVNVGHVFPLAEAREAHEVLQTGHARGKIVLRVS